MRYFDRRRKPPFDRGGGGGGDGGAGPKFSEGTPPVLRFRVKVNGITNHLRPRPPRTLLAPAIKLLGRVGAEMKFDYELLRSDEGFTELGVALVYYSAITTFVFDDPYLFESGKLRELGSELAEQIGIQPLSDTWRRAGVGYGNQAHIYVGNIEEGSLNFWQAVAVGVSIAGGVVTMAAEGPAAIKAYQEVYKPAIVETWEGAVEKLDDLAEAAEDALDVTAEYMGDLFAGMREIIDMTVLPSPPEPTSRQRSTSPVLPPSNNKKRKLPPIRSSG